jgi:hypothetical protein
MSLKNINISRKHIIKSLATTKSYDQFQATLNLLFGQKIWPFASKKMFNSNKIKFRKILFSLINLKNT